MKVMKQSVFVFVILAAVFVSCWGDDTDEDVLGKRKPSPAPGFDYFLLALTWPNQYCTTHYCKPPVPTQSTFTIHGLWPQFTNYDPPKYCNDPTRNFNVREALQPMKEELLEYWPDLKNAGNFEASMNFWTYQWNKHGICSSNKFWVQKYFQKSIDLAKEYSPKINAALENKGVIPNGNEYREVDILSAVAEGIGVVPSLGYDNQRSALLEIRLCVANDAVTLIDCEKGGKLTFAAPPYPSSSSRSTSGVSSVLETVHNATASSRASIIVPAKLSTLIIMWGVSWVLEAVHNAV